MLTKGTEKLKRSDGHSKAVSESRSSDEGFFHCNDSSDDTTWCQLFVMPEFQVMFTRLLGNNDLTKTIARVLNLVTSKRIMVPKDLLLKFLDSPNQPTYNESIKELRSQFLGVSEHDDLINVGEIYVKNTCNMMQGILHFTSSLYHVAIDEYSSDMSRAMIKRNFPSSKIFITSKISSDDSGREVSVSYKTEEDKRKLKFLLIGCSKASGKMYKFAGAKDSIKSTRALTNGIYEFNSVWKMMNTLAGIDIKFAWVALRMPCMSRFTERQEILSNARRSMMANGCGSMMTAFVQKLQMETYYIFMGSRVSESFSDWLNYQRRSPSPVTGLFLLEPDVSVGLCGYELALYNFLSISEKNLNLYSKLLMSESSGLFDNALYQSSLNLSFGAGKKFQSFRQKLGFNREELNDEITKDPSVLFRRVSSKAETLTKLNYLTSAPSIGNSFMFLCDSKLHASAVFILRGECLTKKTRIINEGKLEILEEKTSLLDFLKLAEEDKTSSESISLDAIFPNKSFLDLFLKVSIEVVPIMTVSNRTSYKMIKYKYPKRTNPESVNIESLIKHFWFGQSGSHSERTFKSQFDIVQARIPWMKNSFEETLKESPFSDPVSFFRYLSSTESSMSSFEVMSSGKFQSSTYSTLKDIITFSCCRSKRWASKSDKEPINIENEKLSSLINFLCMIDGSFCTGTSKAEFSFDRMKSMRPLIKEISTDSLSGDDFLIALFQSACSDPSINIVSELKKFHLSEIGYWAVEQKKNNVTNEYEGRGEFYQEFGKIKTQIMIENDEISIVTNNVSMLESYGNKLLKVISRNFKSVVMKSDFMGKRLNFSGRIVDRGLGYRIVEREIYREFPLNIKVTLMITNGRLRGVSGSSEIFSVRPSMKSIFKEGKEEFKTGDKILDCWIQNKKLDPFLFFKQTKRGNRIYFLDPILSMKRSWARETMIKRALRIGRVGSWATTFGVKEGESIHEEIESEDEDYDNMIQKIMDEIGLCAEDVDIGEIKMEEDDD
jgi:hypothetical protein